MNGFWWAAGDDGCWWYRIHLVTQALGLVGHTCRESTRAVPSWVADADVVVGQRVCQPNPSVLWQKWAAEGRRLVFDVDDDLSVVDPSSRQAFAFFSQPQVQRRIEANMRVASRVTAASERIAVWARRFNDDVVVVPNGLPAGLLSRSARVSEQGAPVVVGWVGSSQSLPELALAAPALVRLLDTYRGRVVVHTIGVPRPALKQFELDRPDVRVTQWTAPGHAYLSMVDFDIWVAPYRDTPFNQAKYPTKSLEAQFLSVPLIASDTAPYRESVDHGVTGFVVKQPHEWGRFLKRLVDDEGLRREMARAAFASAAGHVVEGLVPAWERALWQ